MREGHAADGRAVAAGAARDARPAAAAARGAQSAAACFLFCFVFSIFFLIANREQKCEAFKNT